MAALCWCCSHLPLPLLLHGLSHHWKCQEKLCCAALHIAGGWQPQKKPLHVFVYDALIHVIAEQTLALGLGWNFSCVWTTSLSRWLASRVAGMSCVCTKCVDVVTVHTLDWIPEWGRNFTVFGEQPLFLHDWCLRLQPRQESWCLLALRHLPFFVAVAISTV